MPNKSLERTRERWSVNLKRRRARRSAQSLGLVRHIADIAGAVLLSWMLAGCVPAIIRRSPAVTGTVAFNGVPLAAADAFVQSDGNAACSASALHVVTDTRGSFTIPAGHSFEWYSLIQLGDRGFGWRLCFEYEGRSYVGYQEVGWGSAPKVAHVECELSSETSSTGDGPPRLYSCKRHEP